MTGASYSIGIDLGGTHTRVGLVDQAGALLEARRRPTVPNAAELMDWMADSIADLTASGRPRAVGLAVPGALAQDRSMIVRAVNLPFLERMPLRDTLARRVGLEVVLDTDVAAAAWGEYVGGDSRPGRFVFLAIGTGIGAAAILNGQLVRHTHGGAGHFGQMIVDSSPEALRGDCGTHGSLEACAAGPALERAAQAAGLSPSLAELRMRCQRGDAAANEVVNRAARFLAIGLVNVALVYAPDRIAVGGGAAAALPELVTRAAGLVADLGGDLVPPNMVVQPAALGDDAGMIGAAMLAQAPTIH